MFPNSVYLYRVEDQVVTSGMLSNSNFKDTITSYLINKVQQEPSNYFNYRYVYLISYYLKDNEALLKDTLTQISKSNKGTLLQKIIDNYLEETEARKQFEIKKN